MGIRVYQLAREIGLSSAEVVSRCAEVGVFAENHMSKLSDKDATRVRSAIKKKILKDAVESELAPKLALAQLLKSKKARKDLKPCSGLSSAAEDAARCHALRLGFRLADCREVALPVYKLHVVVVIEEHNPIPDSQLPPKGY